MLLLEDAEYWLERPTELERALRLAAIREDGPHPGPIGIGGGRARVEPTDLDRYADRDDVLVVTRPGYFADHLDEVREGLEDARTAAQEESWIDLDALREQRMRAPEPERDERDHGLER